ncbi:MAG: hypothetical protein PHR24_04280 [Oscillospiraceae bacterium]|nr:hypothetical protein [Oscillospiraceae bacterium]
MLILISNKNQDIFAVCFPPYSVVVVGGRQPALLLRLAWRKTSSQILSHLLLENSISLTKNGRDFNPARFLYRF